MVTRVLQIVKEHFRMRSFEDIKDHISFRVKGKVFDKHVAEALGVSTSVIALHKSRGTLPLADLCDFCNREKLNINKLLYGREV